MNKKDIKKIQKLYIAAKAQYTFWKEQNETPVSGLEEKHMLRARKNYVMIMDMCDMLEVEKPIISDNVALKVYNRWIDSPYDSFYDKEWRGFYSIIL